MKKYISFALIMVLAVFSAVGTARAEEGTSTGEVKPIPSELKAQFEAQREALKNELEAKKEAFKTEMEAKREAFKKELEAKKAEFQASLKGEREAFKAKLEAQKAEFKANFESKKGEFRGKAKSILSERFESAVKNLTNGQTRVASVIEKVKASGKDTTQAEVYLADSKTKLADAVAKLAALKASIPTTDEKVTVENWEVIKQGANDVKALMKESHASLVEAIKSLKGMGKIEKADDNDDSEDTTDDSSEDDSNDDSSDDSSDDTEDDSNEATQ
jgi:hypothetical protein